MGRSFFLAALAVVTPLTQAHFRVVRLAHNGVWQDPIRYIRNVTNGFKEQINPPDYKPIDRPRYWIDPAYYFDEPNSVRCGRGNMKNASSTELLQVKAGDTIEFAWSSLYPESWIDKYFDCADGRGFCVYSDGSLEPGYPMRLFHTGPVSTYLSKVAEGQLIEEYDGSGEWVKIHTTGAEMLKNMTRPHWLPNNNDDVDYGTGTQGAPARMPFQIPKQTPAGQYLLRVDFVYNHWIGTAQLYPSCAHVEVESAASGALPKGVKFPEVYDPAMPGMTTSYLHGAGDVLDPDYVYPGGDLWTGENMVVDRPNLTPI